jgi:RNA polymerase sigma-70 factor (ECF subfamily)
MYNNTEAIWNEFHKELMGFIVKRVKNRDTAADILQDVFVKVHLKHDTLEDNDKLINWLYQITRNTILDHFRKIKYFDELNEDLIELNETTLYNQEFTKCLLPMIKRLPQKYSDAILKTELGNMNQKEFAQKSNLSYSAAKSRVQRGRQKLSVMFKECCKIQTDRYGNILDYHLNENCTLC